MRVGQLVTWPKACIWFLSLGVRVLTNLFHQLHIIENRYRLEKQILLGRQAVRRAMRTRAQERIEQSIEAEPQEQLYTPHVRPAVEAKQSELVQIMAADTLSDALSHVT